MKVIKYSVMLLFSLGLLSVGCTSEKEEMSKHHFDNKVFIDMVENINETIVKAGGNTECQKIVAISSALQMENTMTATFAPNPDMLEAFRSGYNPDAVLYPVENCRIENAEVTIEKGSNTSTPATVKFMELNKLDMNIVYVMPVSLTNVQGAEVLQSKTTVYYVFKGGALINVVCNMTENRAGAKEWKNESALSDMKEFTIEFLVRPNKFGRLISTVMGVEGHFLLRFGDAGVPDNQLQVASSRNHTNGDLSAEAGIWTHFAVVFNNGHITVYKNGSEKLSESDGRDSVTFGAYGNDKGEVNGDRYFWVGYSYSADRFFDGEMSELRIWNKCLTKEEINAPAHFYSVDASDPALAAYWKCDDATGLTLKDYSTNGNDLTLDNECKWPNVSLPESK